MTAREDRIRVVFLAGIGRSGTTLIERTLGGVAGITALGEVMHLWHRGLVRHELCACGVPFPDCPFWSAVGREAFGGWDQIDVERMAHLRARVDRTVRIPYAAGGGPAWFRREADEYVDHYVRLYAAAARLTGGVLVDSSKQASLAWLLRRSPTLDLRVVHCVRDSRGVAHSWAKVIARPEATDEKYVEMPRYGPSTMSAYWTYHNAAASALRRRTPYVRLRYEDFVKDPAGAVSGLLAFAGVHAIPTHIDGSTVRLGRNHSCAGNPMRFREGDVPVLADDRWRQSQSLGTRRLVTALTAPSLLRYRYLGRP